MSDQPTLDLYLKKRIKKLSYPITPIATDQEPKLKKLTSIKAVLFDVYGTMLISDTGEVGVDSISKRGNQAIKDALEFSDIEYNKDITNVDLFGQLKEFIHLRRQEMFEEGNPSPEVNIINIWRRFLEQLWSDTLIKKQIAGDQDLLQKLGVEFELRFNPCWPMPSLEGALNKLRKDQYLLGIISNSQFYTPLAIEALMDRSLSDLGFSPSLLYWSYKHGISKPAIGFYEPAAQKLLNTFEVQPDEVLYIGNDMLNDIYPAHEIGFNTALFAGDKRSLRLRKEKKQTQGLSPDLTITRFEQLFECLD